MIANCCIGCPRQDSSFCDTCPADIQAARRAMSTIEDGDRWALRLRWLDK